MIFLSQVLQVTRDGGFDDDIRLLDRRVEFQIGIHVLLALLWNAAWCAEGRCWGDAGGMSPCLALPSNPMPFVPVASRASATPSPDGLCLRRG